MIFDAPTRPCRTPKSINYEITVYHNIDMLSNDFASRMGHLIADERNISIRDNSSCSTREGWTGVDKQDLRGLVYALRNEFMHG